MKALRYVVVEKPLAIDPSQARELLALASIHARVLVAAPVTTLSPTYKAVDRIIRTGQIGRVLSARWSFGHSGPRWAEWFNCRWSSRMKTVVMLALTGISMVCCGGCEEAADIVAAVTIGNVFGRYVAITTDSAPPGQVGVAYGWDVYAGVKNEPFDDLYDYEFRIRRGVLPAGLSFSSEDRHASIQGVPRESGDFPITIRVSSDTLRFDEMDPANNVRSSSDDKEFIIHIDP